MSELGWKDAIIQVLMNADVPMHYVDIAQEIADKRLKTKVGATPPASVSATISVSLQNEGDESPFIKVSRGYFTVKNKTAKPELEEIKDETGFLNAFGMYWKREDVSWKNNPKVLGKQQGGSKDVDFCKQKGVYLLHDGSKVIYVGRTTDQTLGTRLYQHTSDRLNGRWDRFSWFGIFSVSDNGDLEKSPPMNLNIDNLIATMEALLIEGLEPPQNRKRGDDFSAVEFLQAPDPEIKKIRMRKFLEELKDKIE